MRALQFLADGEAGYRCEAGSRLITIMPNGDVYPCRRLPIGVGNVRETDLTTIYFESPLFLSLREDGRVSQGREACKFDRRGHGGLRCLAYAVTGDPFRADPGCWLSGPDDCGPAVLEPTAGQLLALPDPRRMVVR